MKFGGTNRGASLTLIQKKKKKKNPKKLHGKFFFDEKFSWEIPQDVTERAASSRQKQADFKLGFQIRVDKHTCILKVFPYGHSSSHEILESRSVSKYSSISFSFQEL